MVQVCSAARGMFSLSSNRVYRISLVSTNFVPATRRVVKQVLSSLEKLIAHRSSLFDVRSRRPYNDSDEVCHTRFANDDLHGGCGQSLSYSIFPNQVGFPICTFPQSYYWGLAKVHSFSTTGKLEQANETSRPWGRCNQERHSITARKSFIPSILGL